MTDKEKKDFFNRIDNKYSAKNEAVTNELTSAQKKLPPALQKAIKAKEKKEESVNWAEAAEEQEKRQEDAKYFKTEAKDIPPIDKDNKPGVKIAKIRAMKGDDKEKKESEIEKLKDQNALLKQKLENEINSRFENENNQSIDIKKLDDIHNLKTGKLIECAVMLGQIGSSLESESLNALRDFSSKIGLAFQITDDILDVTQIESILGKNKNSDAKNNKLTYIDIIGLGEAKLKANKLTDLALNSLNQSNITNIDKLIEMAKYLIGRES